jgi:hypothetical protein
MEAQALENVTISMLCHNSPGIPNYKLPVPFEYKQTTPDGMGQASSHRVQFNINKEAVKGTIFVNEHNDGICVATITSNHIVVDAGYVFIPEGSSTEGFAKKPHDVDKSVSVTWKQTTNKEVTFSVHRVGPEIGNVTLVFFVRYQATV